MQFTPVDSRKAQFNLELIRVRSKKSHRDWADFLGLSVSDYQHKYLIDPSKISFMTICQAADNLGLLPEHLLGKLPFDSETARKRAGGDREYLPEKYIKGAVSRRRSLSHMIEYINNTRSQLYGSLALDRFQITPESLKDPEATLNLNFFEEFLDHLANDFQFDAHEFTRMGTYAFTEGKNTPVAKELVRSKSPQHMYERLFVDLQPLVDRNCSYHIRRTFGSVIEVDAIPKEEICDALGKKRIGSKFICLWKIGVINAITGFMNLPLGASKEIQCIHRGDPFCRFHINFDQAEHTFRQRLKTGGEHALLHSH